MSRDVSTRNSRGGAIIGLTLACFLFLLFIGIFCFDMNRMQMAEREMTALCDAASLAGTSMLATANVDNDDSNYDKLFTAQTNAQNYATNMVLYGTVLGRSLTVGTNAFVVGSPAALTSPQPVMYRLNIFTQYTDPTNNYAPVDINTPANRPLGKSLQVQVAYGYMPLFISFLGFGPYTLKANSYGGLPQVDTVMVFDFSGSMDDNTFVTFVNRVWHNDDTSASNEYMEYRVVANGASGSNSYQLNNYINWNYGIAPNGSNINVLPPQSLDYCGTVPYPYSNPPLNTIPTPPGTIGYQDADQGDQSFAFDMYTRANTATVGVNDYGSPPGNCWRKYGAKTLPAYQAPGNGSPSTFNAPTTYIGGQQKPFTDLVVNIDDPSGGGTTPPPYVQPIQPRGAFMSGPFNPPSGGLVVTFPSASETYTVPDVTSGGSITLFYEPDPDLQGNTFTFTNLGALVEASRGNLESSANMNAAFNSMAGYPVNPAYGWGSPAFPSAKVGYQKAYYRLATLYSQPIATALDGAYSGFYQKLNVLADCRYGFVGFSCAYSPPKGSAIPSGASGLSTQIYDNSGTGTAYSTMVYTNPAPPTNMGYYWCHGSSGLVTTTPTPAPPTQTAAGFRIPRSPLSASATQTNSWLNAVGMTKNGATYTMWSDIVNSNCDNCNGLFSGIPINHTDTDEALQAAINSFQNAGVYNYTTDRPAARRAVIFFTDGEPTNGSVAANTTAEMPNLKAEGASLYCVALALNSTLTSYQVTFMGEQAGGLAGDVGNGSKLFQVSSAADVKSAFGNVVRRLTQAQK